MKKLSTILVFLVFCLSAFRLYAVPDSLTRSVFVYPKASVGCYTYVSYQGSAPSSASYTWNFDGGIIVSGSGQGPYYIHWDTVGYKTVTLQVYYQSQTCNSHGTIHIVDAPLVYNVTGGGNYPYGGTGVPIGLSGSQHNYSYYLYLNGGSQSVATATGTGSTISFGLFTTAGTYTCKAKVDSASGACLEAMHDSAVVTVSGYVPTQYICMVTYDTTSQRNEIVWDKVTGYHLSHFNIYRQTAHENEFIKIGQVSYTHLSTFIDTTVNPIIMAEKYEMTVTDSSGNESNKSPYHKTVHLEVSPGAFGFDLIWNPYEGFTFLTYRIHRKLMTGGWQLIDSVASDQISYTDPYITTGLATYYLEVVRYSPCTPTLKSEIIESVISNNMTAAPLGLTELNAGSVLIYPNPAKNNLTVMVPAIGQVEGTIELYSVDGRKWFSQGINQSKTALDISALPAGMYFLKVVSKEWSGTGRFVKE